MEETIAFEAKMLEMHTMGFLQSNGSAPYLVGL
jgi:hypothetical protein